MEHHNDTILQLVTSELSNDIAQQESIGKNDAKAILSFALRQHCVKELILQVAKENSNDLLSYQTPRQVKLDKS